MHSLERLETSGLLPQAALTLKTGLTTRHEGFFQTDADHRTWIDYQAVRFSRNKIKHLLFLVSDITERKRMELGGLVCRPKTPDCPRCPLCRHCQALHLEIVADRPVLSRTPDIVPLNVATGVLVQAGRVFIQKRLPKGAWANLWEFPGGRIEPGETPEAAIVREYDEETGFATSVAHKLSVIRHGYTTYRVTLHCFLLHLSGTAPEAVPPVPALTAAQQALWVSPAELGRYAFPAGHRKLIDQMAQSLWRP